MSALLKLITLVVIATGLAYHFSGFLQLPYSSGEEPLESFMANFTPRIINKLGHTKLICCCSGPNYPVFSDFKKKKKKIQNISLN